MLQLWSERTLGLGLYEWRLEQQVLSVWSFRSQVKRLPQVISVTKCQRDEEQVSTTSTMRKELFLREAVPSSIILLILFVWLKVPQATKRSKAQV